MEPKTREEILAIYSRRTDFLANNDKSPVPLEVRRRGFKGLDYYPVDPKYQIKVKLQQYSHPERVPIATSNGQVRRELRAGFLEFELDNKKLVLQFYKHQVQDSEIFVPFKDKTSGKETYGGGRYVDVEVDPTGDTCILDFNLSGNPLCAFSNGDYDCPIPPRENLLDVEIRAGEKKFKD